MSKWQKFVKVFSLIADVFVALVDVFRKPRNEKKPDE